MSLVWTNPHSMYAQAAQDKPHIFVVYNFEKGFTQDTVTIYATRDDVWWKLSEQNEWEVYPRAAVLRKWNVLCDYRAHGLNGEDWAGGDVFYTANLQDGTTIAGEMLPRVPELTPAQKKRRQYEKWLADFDSCNRM